MVIAFEIKTFVVSIDDIDIDLLEQTWHILISKKTGFKYVRTAVKRNGKFHGQLMHRLILARKLGRELLATELCDHADGDTFNNQRSNLRVATNTQNNVNSRVYKNNKLGVKGVRQTKRGKFEARIRVNKKLITLGYFDTSEEAHEAYVTAAKKHHGEFANSG